ncbi:MAG: AIR synthase-related protein [bacterium]
MIHRIEVLTARRHPDPAGLQAVERIRRFSELPLDQVRTMAVYSFDGTVLTANGERGGGEGRGGERPGRETTAQQALRLGEELFADPILHLCRVDGGALEEVEFDWYVEVGFLPGVTDNVGRTARESIEYRLGRPFPEGSQVHASTGYFLRGSLTRQQAEALAREWLANELIQQVLVLGYAEIAARREELFRLPLVALDSPVAVERVALDSLDDLQALSRDRVLALSREELEAIRAYYARPEVLKTRRAAGLGPEATDVELEMLAQTWSEHCKHKIFNAEIDYSVEGEPGGETIRSLYKTYIQGATQAVRERLGEADWCLSVFTDNAGVVRFDDDWSFVFKVETHNSPSALDPYGGALTGIVGVNRDPFGTGRGAELLFNTDVFCFASPFHSEPLPPRLLHPRRIYEGVRLGVEHGGNKSGIPTVNGSVSFHEGFLGKPLVFCGTGGLLPARIGQRPGHEKWVDPGDRIVMVGGRIGKDGIHGATFSSQELHEGSPVTAVQIGDPIVQKKMFDFLLRARDGELYNAITDNGAGGLSSSVGEMAEMSGGAEIELEKAPLKYPGLQPWEILVSEAQERMTLAVPPNKVEPLLALAREMQVEATVLGKFTDSGYFRASYQGRVAALLEMEFLHHGLPTMKLKAHWRPPPAREPATSPPADLGATLLALLGRLNVCSKESLVRQYDHEVQGASVIKPLVGAANDGPSDAAVLRPVLESTRGLAIAHGICPRYSELDTYAMAAAAFDEAVRGVVAVGGDPERIAALDNFCWCDPLPAPGNPEAEHKLGQLVRAARAVHDVALAYGVPLISGKDSMKNDYVHGQRRISIPPTLLVSAVAIVPDVRRAVTMDLKAPGHLLYLLGQTRRELGGSEYFAQLGLAGGQVPTLQPEPTRDLYRALGAAIAAGWVSAAHDCSDGGLAVTLAEMAFAGNLGLTLHLGTLAERERLAPHELLFSESPGRLAVAVPPQHREPFAALWQDLPCHLLGEVVAEPRLRISRDGRSGGAGDEAWIDESCAALKAAWQKTLGDF